jgi:hypothetical protein
LDMTKVIHTDWPLYHSELDDEEDAWRGNYG